MSTPPPLTGARLLVPRRDDQRLVEALRERGARCDEVRFTRRRPVAGPGLKEALAALRRGDYDWLAVTSAYTLTALADLGHDPGTSVPPTVRVAAVGSATAEAARRAGLEVSLVGTGGGAALAQRWPAGSGRVLIPGAADPEGTLATALRERGKHVDEVTVYRTDAVAELAEDVRLAWAAGRYTAWLATAGSMVRAARPALPPPGPGLITLGPSATRAGRDCGYRVLAEAEQATLPALVTTVVRVCGSE